MSQQIDPLAPRETETLSGIQWISTDSSSLQQTSLGLTLIYYGLLIMLLAGIALVGLVFMVGAAGAGAVVLVLKGCAFALVVGSFLCIGGPIACLAVPEETGARGLLMGSVTMQTINLGYSILCHALPGLKTGPLDAACQTLEAVGALLFLLFMRRLSLYIGRRDLARRANNILIMGGTLIVLFVVMMIGSMAKVSLLGPLLAIVTFVAALLAFVMYVNLINDLRRVLRNMID